MAGIEEHGRLDIRFFHKNKLLRPGLSFPFHWTRGGKTSGNIQIKIENGYLILTYRCTRYEESEDVQEKVYLAWTPCNYGGERPWFRCPGCGRRVAVLIAAGKLFLCRHCYRLKYCSQLESNLDRANSKVQKLRDRLICKGLHQKTRDRLQGKLTEAEIQADELLCMKLARFAPFKEWIRT
jgi:ribosomal protein S14